MYYLRTIREKDIRIINEVKFDGNINFGYTFYMYRINVICKVWVNVFID